MQQKGRIARLGKFGASGDLEGVRGQLEKRPDIEARVPWLGRRSTGPWLGHLHGTVAQSVEDTRATEVYPGPFNALKGP